MAWLDFWGGYLHDGPYNNVVLLGSPNSTGPFSSNLTQAHNTGYGYGINFSQNDNDSIHTKINLVGFALDSNGRVLYGQHYVRFGGTYNYILNIQTSMIIKSLGRQSSTDRFSVMEIHGTYVMEVIGLMLQRIRNTNVISTLKKMLRM